MVIQCLLRLQVCSWLRQNRQDHTHTFYLAMKFTRDRVNNYQHETSNIDLVSTNGEGYSTINGLIHLNSMGALIGNDTYFQFLEDYQTEVGMEHPCNAMVRPPILVTAYEIFKIEIILTTGVNVEWVFMYLFISLDVEIGDIIYLGQISRCIGVI